jgi:predicted histone-like DNA-binding protein
MILYKLRQNTNKFNELSYGKYYAVPVINETVDLDGLSEHMANHNTPFSPGAIKGMLTDMVICIKELLLDGKAVKIDDLAIFKVSIVSKKGCEDKSTYKASEYISGVRMRALAAGELAYGKLNGDASLKRASFDKDDSGDADDGGDDNDTVTTPTTGTTGSGSSGDDGDDMLGGDGDGLIDPLG